MEALLLWSSYVLIHHYHFTGWREANPDHIHARRQRTVLYHTPREVVHPHLFFRHTLDIDMAVGNADVNVATPYFTDALRLFYVVGKIWYLGHIICQPARRYVHRNI